MPARYVSARYIGREDAFGRLAAVLDDAAHGRARAMLVSGPAGVGISRFFDEATGRIAELSEPMTVLRGGAMPAGTDEPYGPLVRGHRAGARRAPGRRARRRARAGGRASWPACCRRCAARLEAGGWSFDGIRPGAPERRQARTMEGVLGMLGRLGERGPSSWSSRTCTAPTPRPGRS